MGETAGQFVSRNITGMDFHREALTRAVEARDAAIAHAARVGVLRELIAYWNRGSGIYTPTLFSKADVLAPCIEKIAARHNITDAELSPPKVWGPEDVKVLACVDSEGFDIMCGKSFWYVSGWLDGVGRGSRYTKYDAEAIRDRIIRDGNYPGGGK